MWGYVVRAKLDIIYVRFTHKIDCRWNWADVVIQTIVLSVRDCRYGGDESLNATWGCWICFRRKQWLSRKLMGQNDILPNYQNRLLNCCRLSTPNPQFIFLHCFLYCSRNRIQLSVSFFEFIFAKERKKKNDRCPSALVSVTPSKSFKRSWYRYYFGLMLLW